MCTCALFVDVHILVDAHFVNVFCVVVCVLVVDVHICTCLIIGYTGRSHPKYR